MVIPRLIYNSRQQMEFAQEWFWYIDQCWFPKQMLSLPTPSEAVEYINEILENAWIQGDFDRALFEIERIQKNLIDMLPFEKAISAKLCAHILIAMADREQAQEMMRQALIWLPSSYRHHVAVFTWLFGVVHWLRSAKHTDAINEWKAAIKLFYDISIDPGLTLDKKKWYEKQLLLMRQALRRAITIDQLPPLQDFDEFLTCKDIPRRRRFGGSGPRFVEDEQDMALEEIFQREAAPFPENFLLLLIIYIEISAGLPGPIAYSPSPSYPAGHRDLEPSDYIEVSRVLIGDQEYAVKLLGRGRQRLSLVSSSYFYAMKVKGDSMNNAGKDGKDAIDNGDYVIMRSQMIAENGDIVAAEIVGVDTSYATLKRYSRRGKTITLKAESKNQKFSGKNGVWEFTEDDENKEGKFFIRGVAIAVLKPV